MKSAPERRTVSRPGAGGGLVSLHSWLRVASILIVCGLALAIRPHSAFVPIVFVFGFVHYALSAFYSRTKITRLLTSPREAFGLLAVIVVAVSFYLGHASLFIVFGLHHVFNEVYLLHRSLDPRQQGQTRSLRLSALVLNALLYLAILRHTPSAHRLDEGWLFVALAVAYVVFFANLFLARHRLRGVSLIDLSLFEVLGLLIFAASFLVKVSFLHVVMYHFVFWTLYPLKAMMRQGPRPVLQYAGLNVILTLGVYLVSPISSWPYRVSPALFFDQFTFWSWIHILTSFSVSVAHPGLIRRLFQPRTLALAPPDG